MISAPETFGSLNIDRGYDQKIDIWSIGCVILEIAIGRNIWSNEKNFEFCMAFRPSAPDIPKTLDEKLQNLLFGCFELDPSKRPSAEEVLKHEFLKTCFAEPA